MTIRFVENLINNVAQERVVSEQVYIVKYLASALAIAIVGFPFNVQATPLASRTEDFLKTVNFLFNNEELRTNLSDEIKLRDGLLLCERLREGKTSKELTDTFVRATYEMPDTTKRVYRDYYASVFVASTTDLCPEYKNERY